MWEKRQCISDLKIILRDFPAGPVFKAPLFPAGAQVWYPLRELRSHMLCGTDRIIIIKDTVFSMFEFIKNRKQVYQSFVLIYMMYLNVAFKVKLTKNWVFICVGHFCCCSVTQLWPTLWDPIDCSIPGFPVLHHLLELAQTHVHWVSDATQPSHPLSSPSPPALNLSQQQGLF